VKPRTYSTTGIILARKNYGEADRILNLYTKDFGRISLIAKGVRKPTSRKRGHIEIFSLLKLTAASGKGLDILIEAELIDSFSEIRKDLNKVSLAYFFMEVIGKMTHEGEKHEELFYLILKNLNRLKDDQRLKTLKDAYIVDVLVLLGFWPKGEKLINPEDKLEEITERHMSSKRVGKLLVS
jgi:DNA repair protein RecO (recombination protein O)